MHVRILNHLRFLHALSLQGIFEGEGEIPFLDNENVALKKGRRLSCQDNAGGD